MTHLDTTAAGVDPWRLELVVVRGAARSSTERSTIARDADRGLLLRLGPGVYVDRLAFEAQSPEGRHLVPTRALAATSDRPVVFSHWSAAVLHGLPAQRHRLARVHVLVKDGRARAPEGVAQHCFQVDDRELVRVHDLLVTSIPRTVVDLAGAAALEEGVMAADAVLCAGLPREVLEVAVDVAGPRRASSRIADAIAFAHPGVESAAESRTRVTAYRIGVPIPELQHEVLLTNGRSAFLDEWFPDADADAALEVDGDTKYLDTRMAPRGTAAALIDEKRREDDIRTRVRAMARVGWIQSGDTSLLRPILTRVGVHRLRTRPAFEDWCAAARAARPRRRRPR